MNLEKAAAALAEMMADRRPLPVVMERYAAYCVACTVQLACRHPEFTGHIRAIAESVARQILSGITTDPDLTEICVAGWNRNCDVRDLGAPPDAAFQPVRDLDLAPRPSDRDKAHVETLLNDPRENHFSAHLFRLIKRSDRENRERLRRVYPHHVESVELWESTEGRHDA